MNDARIAPARRTTRCPPIPLPAYAVATSGPRVLLTPLPAPILIAVPRTGERDRASWATAPERMARKAGSLSEGEDALAGLILEDVGGFPGNLRLSFHCP